MSAKTSAFVKRRHARQHTHTRQRLVRNVRRWQNGMMGGLRALRKWAWVAVFLLAAATLAVLIFSPLVHVREIRIHRTDARVDSEKIQRALRPMFGKHLFFLSGREVEQLVRDTLPDAKEVTVDKQYPSELDVTITLHPLVARLAIDNPDGTGAAPASGSGSAATGSGSDASAPENAPKKTFDYLTDNGLYVTLPFAVDGTATLPLIHVVDWAVRPAPATMLVSAELLKRMRDAEDAMRVQYNMKVTARTVYIRAREFHLGTAKYALWFDLKSPQQDQFSRFRIFLKAVNPNEVHSYVDLRLSGRIVYK